MFVGFAGSFDFLGLNHYTTGMFSALPDTLDPKGTYDNDKGTDALPYPTHWIGLVDTYIVHVYIDMRALKSQRGDTIFV